MRGDLVRLPLGICDLYGRATSMDVAGSDRCVLSDRWRLACRHPVPDEYINLDRRLLSVYEDV